MKKKNQLSGLLEFSPYPFQLLIAIFLLFISSTQSFAQFYNFGEKAVCTAKVGDKYVETYPNQMGEFNKIYHVAPGSVVPIEIYYPNAKPGEKVFILALDGGTVLQDTDPAKGALDKATVLNEQNKCSFNFKLTNNFGLFRIEVDKGQDSKIVQIWVGPEAMPK